MVKSFLNLILKDSRSLLLGVAVLLAFGFGFYTKDYMVEKDRLQQNSKEAEKALKLQDQVDELQKILDKNHEDFKKQLQINKKIITSDCPDISNYLRSGFDRLRSSDKS